MVFNPQQKLDSMLTLRIPSELKNELAKEAETLNGTAGSSYSLSTSAYIHLLLDSVLTKETRIEKARSTLLKLNEKENKSK